MPLPFTAGVKVSRPLLILATEMLCPAVTATPLRRSVPAVAMLVIVTAERLLTGASFGSVKPKLAAVKVNVAPSVTVTVLSVPAGASLTEVTSMVMVFADWSRSTPPLAVPPLSCTWKVKEA